MLAPSGLFAFTVEAMSADDVLAKDRGEKSESAGEKLYESSAVPMDTSSMSSGPAGTAIPATYVLRKTGRYAHSNAYVQRCADAAGLRVIDAKLFTPLRIEWGVPELGHAYLMERAGRVADRFSARTIARVERERQKRKNGVTARKVLEYRANSKVRDALWNAAEAAARRGQAASLAMALEVAGDTHGALKEAKIAADADCEFATALSQANTRVQDDWRTRTKSCDEEAIPRSTGTGKDGDSTERNKV
jgi:hypothetical protein